MSESLVYKPHQYLQKLGSFVSANVVSLVFPLLSSPSPMSSVYIIISKKKKKMQVGVMIETLHGSTRKIWTKWAFALFRQIN